jgi:hypothetical protein
MMRLPTAQAAIAALLLCAALGAARAEQPYDPATAEEQLSARALTERRQRMIDYCERNHGDEVDCERETDVELRAEGLLSGVRVIRLRPAP